MKKLYLSNVIEKYHLGGLVEKIKINISNKILEAKFIASNKNLIGNLYAPDIEIDDCSFGIYDTSQLLKLINITDQLITVGIDKQGKTVNKLTIADSEYNLEYALSDIMLTPSIPVFDEPDYEIEAPLNREFIDKFIKAKKALDTDLFIVMSDRDEIGNNILSFKLGGSEKYTNKINFYIPTIKQSIIGQPVKFPIAEFNEILLANKVFKKGTLLVSEQGLLKIEFETEENVKVSYVLVGKE
jgi:hypothetical protein